MLYLLLCQVDCVIFLMKMAVCLVCRKCSCRTVLCEELLELRNGDFCCFLKAY